MVVVPIGKIKFFLTERYLFTKALKSVGIIIARSGSKSQAIVAARDQYVSMKNY